MTADNPEQTLPPSSAVSSDDTSSATSAAAAAASTTTADGGPDPDPSPGPSIPLQRSASEARGMQSAAAAASAASGGTGQESPGKRSHRHRRAHTTMSSSVASASSAAGSGATSIAAGCGGGGGIIGSSDNGGGGSRSLASGAAAGNGSGNATGSSSAAVDGAGADTATTALQQQQQHEEQDVPKVKLNIPGKNEDEVVVKRKGRFKILKDTAVTVVAPGPGGGSGQASESAAAGAAGAAAITDGPPARVGESSTVSSGATGAKVQQSSARGSPNKPPFPTPHTRSKSDSFAATSGSANAQRGVPARLQGEGGVASAVSLASTAVESVESVESSTVSGSTPAAANTHGSGNTGNANDRVQLTAGTVTSAASAVGTSSATTSPMNVVETITPAASFSPSIQQPHLGASPVVSGNVAVKQRGRFSITPASDDAAGLGGGAGAGSGDPSAPSMGGGVVTSNKRPPQHLQQPRLPPKHQSSQDSEATAPLAPSVDTRRRECEEKMQRSPNNGQIAEARTQPQPQQQQQQSKTNTKRQSLVQEQQGTSGPQNVQEHPSQPAGLFPEKHAPAAATDKLTLGGVISSGNTAGRPGQNHLGKVFYFVEQMKIEVTEADKTMKKMQVSTIGLYLVPPVTSSRAICICIIL